MKKSPGHRETAGAIAVTDVCSVCRAAGRQSPFCEYRAAVIRTGPGRQGEVSGEYVKEPIGTGEEITGANQN
jgi:hypothetical protein